MDTPFVLFFPTLIVGVSSVILLAFIGFGGFSILGPLATVGVVALSDIKKI